MPAKFSGLVTEAGDVIAIYTPCGGGYGDPLERTPAQVQADVLDDYCTPALAFEAYGVVLDEALEIDQAATEARRAELRKPVA